MSDWPICAPLSNRPLRSEPTGRSSMRLETDAEAWMSLLPIEWMRSTASLNCGCWLSCAVMSSMKRSTCASSSATSSGFRRTLPLADSTGTGATGAGGSSVKAWGGCRSMGAGTVVVVVTGAFMVFLC